MAYILEYASPVLNPSGKTLQDEMEKMQNRPTGFVTVNYNFETGSMSKILEQFKWESLKQRRKSSSLILFYKCPKGQASVPVNDIKTLLGALKTCIHYLFKSHMPGLMLIMPPSRKRGILFC